MQRALLSHGVRELAALAVAAGASLAVLWLADVSTPRAVVRAGGPSTGSSCASSGPIGRRPAAAAQTRAPASSCAACGHPRRRGEPRRRVADAASSRPLPGECTSRRAPHRRGRRERAPRHAHGPQRGPVRALQRRAQRGDGAAPVGSDRGPGARGGAALAPSSLCAVRTGLAACGGAAAGSRRRRRSGIILVSVAAAIHFARLPVLAAFPRVALALILTAACLLASDVLAAASTRP